MKNLITYRLFIEHNHYIDGKLDEILDKISQEGINSLSTDEKNFLDSYKDDNESVEDAYKKLTRVKKTKDVKNTGTINFEEYSQELKENEENDDLYNWLMNDENSNIEKNLIKFIKMNPDYFKEYGPRILSVVSNSIKKARNVRGIKLAISVLTSEEFSKKYMDMFY